MKKNIIITTIFSLFIIGCSAEQTSYYKSDFLEKKIVDTYTCNEDDFFFIEKRTGKNTINFIYGGYSSMLSETSHKNFDYSDGVYYLSLNENIASVYLGNEIVFNDCVII